MSLQDRTSRYTSYGNYVYDNLTGQTLRPGDPGWKPEWSAVNRANAAIPQGYHATFNANDSGDPNNYGLRTPTYVQNPGMTDDPEFWAILAGMGGIGAIGAATGGAGLGAGAGGTAAATAGGAATTAPTVGAGATLAEAAGPTTAGVGGVGGATGAAAPFLGSNGSVALAQTGVGALSSYLTNKANAAQQQANADAQKRQFISALIAQNTNIDQSALNENTQRDQAYMNTFNMDPTLQAKDAFRAAAMGTLGTTGAAHIGASGLSNTANFTGDANQYLSPSALSATAGRFYGAADSLSNTASPTNLASLGYYDPTGQYSSGISTDVNNARGYRGGLYQNQRDTLQAALGAVTDPSTDFAAIGRNASSVAGLFGASPFTSGQRPPATMNNGTNGTNDYFNRTSMPRYFGG